MSKERLEEIKQHQYDGYTIWDMGEDNLVWLIEQAERTERLKRENAGLHDILAQIEYQEKDKLLAENKRYREVIKKAIDDLENECLWDALVALKALESEE